MRYLVSWFNDVLSFVQIILSVKISSSGLLRSDDRGSKHLRNVG
jgi:hypothetical protein